MPPKSPACGQYSSFLSVATVELFSSFPLNNIILDISMGIWEQGDKNLLLSLHYPEVFTDFFISLWSPYSLFPIIYLSVYFCYGLELDSRKLLCTLKTQEYLCSMNYSITDCPDSFRGRFHDSSNICIS